PELGLESKRLGFRKCISAPILRVEQHIVLKAAHENPVFVILEEESLGPTHEMAEAFCVSDAPTVVRNYCAHIVAVDQVLDRLAGFKPSCDPVTSYRRNAKCEDERRLREILRRGITECRACRATHIPDETH